MKYNMNEHLPKTGHEQSEWSPKMGQDTGRGADALGIARYSDQGDGV